MSNPHSVAGLGPPDSQTARVRLEVTNRRKPGPPWAAASRLSGFLPGTGPVTPLNRFTGVLRPVDLPLPDVDEAELKEFTGGGRDNMSLL